MKTLAASVLAATVLAVPAFAADQPGVPTGYQVPGCANYKLDPATNRVIQVCEEDAKTFFFERLTAGDSPSTPSNDSETAE